MKTTSYSCVSEGGHFNNKLKIILIQILIPRRSLKCLIDCLKSR